ncbi:MAG: methyltransferase domain-containing protein [Candidatus Bathyarchaeia archaeon]
MIYSCPRCKGQLQVSRSSRKFGTGFFYPTGRSYYCERCNAEYPIYEIYDFEIPDFIVDPKRREIAEHIELANKYAERYDHEEFFENRVIGFFKDFEESKILPDIEKYYYEKNDRIRVLDIGCGTGRMISKLSDFVNAEIYGLDISSGMLKEAADRLMGRKNVKLLIGDSQYLPFQGNVFDVCLMNFGVLSFAPDHDKVLRDLNFVMKRGAIVWMSTYNADGLNFYISKFYEPSTVIKFSEKQNHIIVGGKEVYCRPFSIDELRDLLQKHGFEVIETSTILSILPLLPSSLLQTKKNIVAEWIKRAGDLEMLAQRIDGLNRMGAYLIFKAKKV